MENKKRNSRPSERSGAPKNGAKPNANNKRNNATRVYAPKHTNAFEIKKEQPRPAEAQNEGIHGEYKNGKLLKKIQKREER